MKTNLEKKRVSIAHQITLDFDEEDNSTNTVNRMILENQIVHPQRKTILSNNFR